jgi:predicted CoA-binding protein
MNDSNPSPRKPGRHSGRPVRKRPPRSGLEPWLLARQLLLGGLEICGLGRQRLSACELHIRLDNTREFGMVLSAGSGGLDAGLDASNFTRDRAAVHAAAELTDAALFLQLFRRTLAWQKLAAIAARDGQPPPDRPLTRLLRGPARTGRQPGPAGQAHVLQSLELEPCGRRRPIGISAAQCDFGAPRAARLPRPIHKIDKLIHPASIGIIGVSSSSMNFGRIILRNLMGSGYDKARLCVIRPGETEIDGVGCVEGLKALKHKLDLLIVAVAASAVYELVDEIIESDAVESVMLIPGSLGETKASREPAAALAERINAAHGKPGGGPVFLGANCLGVVSHPGCYDSWFIPLERLPKPAKKPERNSVMLSQSGAFMITRISQNPWLDPRYMLALGNQTDLTHGDMLAYFAEQPEIETIGIYIEGFKDGDGLDFARAVRKATLNGKQVVVYKSGKDRTRHGRRHGPYGIDRRRPDTVRFGGAPSRRHRRRGLQRLRRPVLYRRRPARQEDRRRTSRSDQWRGLRGGRHGRLRHRVGQLRHGNGRTGSRHRGQAPRDSAGQEARRPGRSQEPDRHQSRRRRRSPPADRRSLPRGPEHRRGSGRPRPDRALGTRAAGEQAAPRLRHHRPEEHRAPDAAAGRAQREARDRHRRWRPACTTP